MRRSATPSVRVLFVTWDGPDQNYLESLFLPIYSGLSRHGFSFHVMQFRWGEADVIASARAESERLGIPYTHEPIFRRPLGLPLSVGTAGTVALGARAIQRYVARHRIDVVMPRVSIPAAMVLAVRRRIRARVLFDADGFPADERVDFAGWSSSGASYRAFRAAEDQMVRVADSVITRTRRARRTLVARAGAGLDWSKIHVIANGKDEEVFSPRDAPSRAATRRELGVPPRAPLVVYAGTLGPQYYPQRMFQLFREVHRERGDARFVVLTGQPRVARAAAEQSGVPAASVMIRRVAAAEVPAYLAAADLGLALREPTYSQHAVSPIKVGEYLLSGLPIVATRGVGDLDTQLDDQAGRLLSEVDDRSVEAAARWLLTEALPQRERLRSRCRAIGVEFFGLSRCIDLHAEALRFAGVPA